MKLSISTFGQNAQKENYFLNTENQLVNIFWIRTDFLCMKIRKAT